MIQSVYDKILVQVDLNQKEYSNIGGVKLFLAPKFNPNNREKNPVVAYVLKGNTEIPEGSFVIAHHNYFVDYSPFEVSDGIYSIPYSENIFVLIDKDGSPLPICNNIIADRIEENEIVGIANPKRVHFHDRAVVCSDGFGFKKGDEILMLPFSDYEIVYNWEGCEKRIIRVFSENIIAKVKKC